MVRALFGARHLPTPHRPSTIVGIAVVSVLAGAGMTATMTTALHAQGNGGPAQYCAQFSDGTSPDCSFATFQECDASVSGIGGVCNINPAATSLPSPPQNPLPFDPMAVPPPPLLPPPPGQPSAPLPLPDAAPYQQ